MTGTLKAQSLALGFVLLAFAHPLAASAYSYDELVMLVHAEEKVFGHADYSLSLDQRLSALEATLGGRTAGSESQRLNSVLAKLQLAPKVAVQNKAQTQAGAKKSKKRKNKGALHSTQTFTQELLRPFPHNGARKAASARSNWAATSSRSQLEPVQIQNTELPAQSQPQIDNTSAQAAALPTEQEQRGSTFAMIILGAVGAVVTGAMGLVIFLFLRVNEETCSFVRDTDRELYESYDSLSSDEAATSIYNVQEESSTNLLVSVSTSENSTYSQFSTPATPPTSAPLVLSASFNTEPVCIQNDGSSAELAVSSEHVKDPAEFVALLLESVAPKAQRIPTYMLEFAAQSELETEGQPTAQPTTAPASKDQSPPAHLLLADQLGESEYMPELYDTYTNLSLTEMFWTDMPASRQEPLFVESKTSKLISTEDFLAEMDAQEIPTEDFLAEMDAQEVIPTEAWLTQESSILESSILESSTEESSTEEINQEDTIDGIPGFALPQEISARSFEPVEGYEIEWNSTEEEFDFAPESQFAPEFKPDNLLPVFSSYLNDARLAEGESRPILTVAQIRLRKKESLMSQICNCVYLVQSNIREYNFAQENLSAFNGYQKAAEEFAANDISAELCTQYEQALEADESNNEEVIALEVAEEAESDESGWSSAEYAELARQLIDTMSAICGGTSRTARANGRRTMQKIAITGSGTKIVNAEFELKLRNLFSQKETA